MGWCILRKYSDDEKKKKKNPEIHTSGGEFFEGSI